VLLTCTPLVGPPTVLLKQLEATVTCWTTLTSYRPAGGTTPAVLPVPSNRIWEVDPAIGVPSGIDFTTVGGAGGAVIVLAAAGFRGG